ncbi:hypothetical protein J3458_006870 [Metarhizium acridum]|uniref:uncharacterized protein n=1 Tax=Metarhizium acridum TaxID=92637 RepID=UPI001C6AB6F4|nr:hypothetical protein J3458_006870 [Metarhizium acridum]
MLLPVPSAGNLDQTPFNVQFDEGTKRHVRRGPNPSRLSRRNGRPVARTPCRVRDVACHHQRPVCNRCRRRRQTATASSTPAEQAERRHEVPNDPVLPPPPANSAPSTPSPGLTFLFALRCLSGPSNEQIVYKDGTEQTYGWEYIAVSKIIESVGTAFGDIWARGDASLSTMAEMLCSNTRRPALMRPTFQFSSMA